MGTKVDLSVFLGEKVVDTRQASFSISETAGLLELSRTTSF